MTGALAACGRGWPAGLLLLAVRLSAATNEPMPVLRSGTKGFDICRHSRFTVPTASWLTQSTGNITTSARLTRPPKSPLRSSTPPS